MLNKIKQLSERPYASKLAVLLASVILSVPYAIIASSIVEAPFLSIFLISIVSFYLLIDNLKYLRDKKYRAIYIALNVIKLVLLIYNAKTKGIFLTGSDWENFDHLAKAAIENGASIVDTFNNSQDLFVFLVALAYKTFGTYIDQIFFYIYPLSLLVFRYVYRTVTLLSNNTRGAILAAFIVIVWPVNFVFSLSVLREIPIQTMAIISFYNFVKYIKMKEKKSLFNALLFGVFAALMHSGMLGLPITYLYVWLQDKISKEYRFLKIGALIITGLLLVMVSFTPAWDKVTTQFSGISSTQDLTQSLAARNDALIANTSYISSAPQDMTELIISIPYRLIMFTFSPLIWQVFSVSTLLAFLVDGILQIGLIFILIKIFRKRKKLPLKDKNIIVLAMLCIVLVYGIFSLGTNNYGTAMRHRAKVLPIAATLIGAYYLHDSKKLKMKESRKS